MSGRVLVVVADPQARAALVEQLASVGHAVAPAASVDDALTQLVTTDFDVAVCDTSSGPQAPGAAAPSADEGLRFLRAARATNHRVEVVLIADHADGALAIECLRAGAFDLLQHPVALGELVLSVSRASERRSLRTTERLAAMSQMIFAASDQDDLPNRIVDAACDVMGADDVSLMLLDGEGNLRVAHSNAVAVQASTDPGVAPDQRVAGRVAGRVAVGREPVIITNPTTTQPSTRARVVYSSIVFPLLSRGQVMGVLNLNRVTTQRAFRDSDLAPAGVLAAQIVLALENSRLTHQLVTAERLAGVGELAAGIAHEINNPMVALTVNLIDVRENLRALEMFGRLLEEGCSLPVLERAWAVLGGVAVVEDMQAALQEAQTGAARIREVTAEVHALASHDEAHPGAFRATDAIRSAMRVAGVHLRHRVQVDDSGIEHAWVHGHAGAVAQAVAGLLLVGAEVLDRPGERLHVGLVAEIIHGRVVIAIEHPAIVPGLRRVLGDNDPRSGRVAARARALGTAREIARRHGGDLHVEDAPRGTRLILTLPSTANGAQPVLASAATAQVD